MNQEYLIVHKSILPDYYDDVIRARDLVELDGKSVSEACTAVGISRSTYYKYKDFIYVPTSKEGKKMIIGFKISNDKGTLSNVLNYIASEGCNVLTLNAEEPIRSWSYVTMTVDVFEVATGVNEFIERLKQRKGIKSLTLLAIE